MPKLTTLMPRVLVASVAVISVLTAVALAAGATSNASGSESRPYANALASRAG
jgi:hypothetical protein